MGFSFFFSLRFIEIGYFFVVALSCRIKANCPLFRSRSGEELPTLEVFLRNPSTYLLEFWRKLRKTSSG